MKGQPANPHSSGKMAVKLCVCAEHAKVALETLSTSAHSDESSVQFLQF